MERWAWKSSLSVGIVLFAVLMALSGRYGFQRDELYMLQCGQHLQASYVDQPVLAPLLARISYAAFGLSMPGLRLWPALAVVGTVLAASLLAREFGGGRRAQVMASVAAATMPAVFVSAHVANTTAPMICGQAFLCLMAARIGRTGDTRWWMAAGAVAGLGAEDNHLVALLAIALVTGSLICGIRPDRWLLAGVAIAVALMLPDIWWQATHGWATIAMSHALNERNGGPVGAVEWIVGQIGVCGLWIVFVPIALRFLWRSERPMWRAMVWAYGILFVVFMLTTGKQTYYLTGVYVALVAAAMPELAERLVGDRAQGVWLAVWATVVALVGAFIGLPLLPAADVGWTYQINAVSGESIGWPQLVATVRSAWFSLSASERANGQIVAGNYSEAAAIDELGRGTGLPTAVSGHNAEWWWGPGNANARTLLVVVQVGGDIAILNQNCSSVRVVATFHSPYGIPNIENGDRMYLCTGLHESLGQLWPQLRHYN
jgi:4-amino-4-deoxy-L-arabinose transferase-like glycosyltransferase